LYNKVESKDLSNQLTDVHSRASSIDKKSMDPFTKANEKATPESPYRGVKTSKKAK
jgi:hypothetical protein